MQKDLSRVFNYSLEFYLKRLKLIVLFSLPFIVAFLIPVFVAAPNYLALGAVFLRTGSIPDLSVVDIIITAIAYGVSLFLIADTIVNVNLVVRSKRTLNQIEGEVFKSIQTHALRIFYIYTLMLLLFFIFQLLTSENPFQSWLYPLVTFIISFLLFFVPSAVVIDNSNTPNSMKLSASAALSKPHFVFIWIIIALIGLIVPKLIGDLLFQGYLSEYFVLLVNSLIVLPFLIVLQTQMYMEKYPLAR
ncbi:hypothetical protein HY988_07290 [Candidatus Micrarchaeota archaeon]|nr:hypothetical protein [Candidatus Micrarchaeota archaeon]